MEGCLSAWIPGWLCGTEFPPLVCSSPSPNTHFQLCITYKRCKRKWDLVIEFGDLFVIAARITQTNAGTKKEFCFRCACSSLLLYRRQHRCIGRLKSKVTNLVNGRAWNQSKPRGCRPCPLCTVLSLSSTHNIAHFWFLHSRVKKSASRYFLKCSSHRTELEFSVQTALWTAVQ